VLQAIRARRASTPGADHTDAIDTLDAPEPIEE
jgi:hypothetical protein